MDEWRKSKRIDRYNASVGGVSLNDLRSIIRVPASRRSKRRSFPLERADRKRP